MIDILESANIKEAVLLCIMVMTLFNAVFIVSCMGVFNHLQTAKINRMKQEVMDLIKNIAGF